MMRLDKMLAQSNLGTRKAVKALIREALVTVNDKVVIDATVEINPYKDNIKYQGEPVTYQEPVYYMFHKPAGCITARKDEKHNTVMEYFKEVNTGGLFPVGRLDKDTEGLLLLTNDGEFNHKMMYPTQKVIKTYYFLAFGSLSFEDRREIEAGVYLKGDENLTTPCKLEIIEETFLREIPKEKTVTVDILHKPELLERAVVGGYLSISEGRKHQVKRMLKAKGCNVFYLKRISVGNIQLDATLEKGKFRLLTPEESEVANFIE